MEKIDEQNNDPQLQISPYESMYVPKNGTILYGFIYALSYIKSLRIIATHESELQTCSNNQWLVNIAPVMYPFDQYKYEFLISNLTSSWQISLPFSIV